MNEKKEKRMFDKMKIMAFNLLIFVSLTGCKQWDNFTTYFNTYYNMERLLKESREEFEYSEIGKKTMPEVLVPEAGLKIPRDKESSLPPFLEEFIITKQQRQPVNVKLDSMIIKGSK